MCLDTFNHSSRVQSPSRVAKSSAGRQGASWMAPLRTVDLPSAGRAVSTKPMATCPELHCRRTRCHTVGANGFSLTFRSGFGDIIKVNGVRWSFSCNWGNFLIHRWVEKAVWFCSQPFNPWILGARWFPKDYHHSQQTLLAYKKSTIKWAIIQTATNCQPCCNWSTS